VKPFPVEIVFRFFPSSSSERYTEFAQAWLLMLLPHAAFLPPPAMLSRRSRRHAAAHQPVSAVGHGARRQRL